MFDVLQDGGDFYVSNEGQTLETVKIYSAPFAVNNLDDAELARMWFRKNTFHGANTLYRFLEA